MKVTLFASINNIVEFLEGDKVLFCRTEPDIGLVTFEIDTDRFTIRKGVQDSHLTSVRRK